MKISEHFKLYEVVRSSTAVRLGIDNSLPQELIPTAKLIAENILEPVRKYFALPISPQSWYRCPELNTAIRGSSRSEHLLAGAVDIEIPGVSNLELAYFIKEELQFNQLILEHYNDADPHSGWVHCSYHEFVNANKVSRFDGKSYKIGLEG